MEQLLCEDVLPGVVVFGRVTSFPWWPAIVGRCPTNGEWSDSQERRWVFFFNDNSGAWLKIRDMRPFTEWTRETMSEINNTNPRYRKHLQSIAGATVLAEEYMRAPVIPRPLSEYNESLTYAALDMEPPAQNNLVDSEHLQASNALVLAGTEGATRTVGSKKSRAFGSSDNSIRRGKSLKRRRATITQSIQNSEPAETTVAHNTGQSGAEADQRPRRRRKKSVRYQGFDDPFKLHGRGGKHKTTDKADAVNVGESAQQEEVKVSRILLSLPLKGRKGAKNIAQWKKEGNTAISVIPCTPEPEKGDAMKPVGKAVTINKNNRLILRINGVALPRPDSSPRLTTKKIIKLARQTIVPSTPGRANDIVKLRRKTSPVVISNANGELNVNRPAVRRSVEPRSPALVAEQTARPSLPPRSTNDIPKSGQKRSVLLNSSGDGECVGVNHVPEPRSEEAGSLSRIAKQKKPVNTDMVQSPPKRANNTAKPRRETSFTGPNGRKDDVGVRLIANGVHLPSIQNAEGPAQTPSPDGRDDIASSSTETISKSDQAHLPVTHAGATARETAQDAVQQVGAAQDAAPDTARTADSKTLYELLNRMSSLEGHVQSLQVKVGRGDDASAGEDASAAALKAAVQTLTRAAKGFAKSRGYEAGTICAGIDALWPDLQPDHERADSVEAARQRECARSIARSLVLTASQAALRR